MDTFLRGFASHFVEAEDSKEEARQKSFVARVCLVLLILDVTMTTVTHVLPSSMHDHDLPESLVADAMCLCLFLMLMCILAHMYKFGLTLLLKFSIVLSFFAYVTINDICNHVVPYHFAYVLVLDMILVMWTEKHEASMSKLLNLVRAMMISYLLIRALSNNGILPGIHPFKSEVGEEARHGRTNLLCDFAISLVPTLANFRLMRGYQRSARKEAKQIRRSEEVASLIADHLVNFDLDTAQEMLARADVSSPVHKPLDALLQNLRSYRGFLPYALFTRAEHADPPNELMADAMQAESVSWAHINAAVRGLRDPAYSLKHFHQDVNAAFPELKLYDLAGVGAEDKCSSGHSGFEEYQRTMGAMYSVYCLARLDIDGREVLTFGVDEDWRPRRQPHGEEAAKMSCFYDAMDWEAMAQLLLRANLLTVSNYTSGRLLKAVSGNESQGSVFSKKGGPVLKVNHDRMTAMLVLTAVHDVMKNTGLLPKVQKRHAPWNRLAEGSPILDHDMALAYIMEHFPSLLPSYHALEPGQRAPVLFTQGKMGFNNGWLVQGEAPPGALFSTFKRVIVEGCAGESDVSFYFVHWLTDLAGAVPYDPRPWPGAEKFVTKFPLRVLNAFLESFAYVDHLATKSEVEVMEEYLKSRWRALGPPVPYIDEDLSLAAMRLALMAQGFEAEAVEGLRALSHPQRDLIADEMARTGRREQFRAAPAAVGHHPAGPALLVYYAPALVQKAGAAQIELGLVVMSAVYRAARLLFPLEKGACASESTVTIRIDALKVLTPKEIMEVGAWHLRRISESDAEAVQGEAPDAPGEDGDGPRVAEIKLRGDGTDQYCMDLAEDLAGL